MSTLQYNSNREYWGKWFPADLISESFPGQFRNWFYSLLAMSTILERRAPFRHVFSYATLLAEDGRPMHKSWGNAIEFNEAADKMGVDVMRWMYMDHKPEKDLLFGFNRADEVRRQTLLPLWNVYSFFVTYANIDRWSPDEAGTIAHSQLDRWVLARINELVEEVTARLEAYEPNLATAAIDLFLNDLSTWYLRRSRRRFWARAGASRASDSDKNAAYATLYHVLVTLLRLIAPFMPFVAEAMYQNLVRDIDESAPLSIHHNDWPSVEEALLDPTLTQRMKLVSQLVSLGHAARNKANIKVRQPLAEIAYAVASAEEREVVEHYSDIIADELNVKQVRLLDAASEVVDYKLHPLPKQLGQKHKELFPAIRKAIEALEAEQAALRILAGRSIEIMINGELLHILPDEIEVRLQAHRGFSAVSQGAHVAALNTEVSEELAREGLAREFVRRVQELRKAAELEVDDRIVLEYSAQGNLKRALETHREYVLTETLAEHMDLRASPQGEAVSRHEFDGQSLVLALSRVES